MAAETYKYFKPDTVNLRAAYGGDAILDGGDSAEVDVITLTTRAIFRSLDLPDNGTHFLNQNGSDGVDLWMKISDNLYPDISAYLSAVELASVVSSLPAGYVNNSTIPIFNPKVGLKNLFVIGDSLSSGTSGGGLPSAPSKQALDLIETTEEIATEPAGRGYKNSTWVLSNMALGGSSFANTDTGSSYVYPFRFDLSFNQRFRTLALNGGETSYIHIWLGSNDLAYDLTISGSDVWDRFVTAIGQLNTEFPNTHIIVGTAIRRSENATLNGRINDFNTLMRANYLTAGASYLADFEASHASFDTSTGDSTDMSVYTGDGVHLIEAGYAVIGGALKDILETL